MVRGSGSWSPGKHPFPHSWYVRTHITGIWEEVLGQASRGTRPSENRERELPFDYLKVTGSMRLYLAPQFEDGRQFPSTPFFQWDPVVTGGEGGASGSWVFSSIAPGLGLASPVVEPDGSTL